MTYEQLEIVEDARGYLKHNRFENDDNSVALYLSIIASDVDNFDEVNERIWKFQNIRKQMNDEL